MCVRPIKYELTGKDLPKLYAEQQDSIFHVGESWELARGDGWIATIETCGELNILKNGEPVSVEDVIAEYDTDEKLAKAFGDGDLECDPLYLQNNNWYEVCFYADTKNGLFFIDGLTDSFALGDFNECIELFNSCMADKEWCDDLVKYVEEIRKEQK